MQDIPVEEVVQQLNHIAIIPDGNRRWAKSQHLPPEAGHRSGFLEVSPKLFQMAWEHHLHTITLWLFSTENWRRSQPEIQHLMLIYEEFLQLMLPIAQQLSVNMKHLGRKDRIPDSLLSVIKKVEGETQAFKNHQFNFALDYGGRDEIVRAVQNICQILPSIEKINEKLLDTFMETTSQAFPHPDLIIRTSGETRISGFMPWQSIYSELYFVDKYYPDFNWKDFQAAMKAFISRERRFGR